MSPARVPAEQHPAFALAAKARFMAGELSGSWLGDPAGHPPVISDAASGVAELGDALRLVAHRLGGRRGADQEAAAGLRAAGRIAAAALPRLRRRPRPVSPGRRRPGAGRPQAGGRAAVAADGMLEAAGALAAALRERDDLPSGHAGLADDVAGALAATGHALRQAAFHAAPATAAHLHASAFIIDAALAPAADACTRLELAGFPLPARRELAALGAADLAGPASFTVPGDEQVDAHVRYAEAVTRYRTGQPPRDAADRQWHVALAAADLAEAWHDARQDHFGPGRNGHAACPDGHCPLAGEAPEGHGPDAARAARWLADAGRARHLETGHGAACKLHCPWDARDLPQAERAARALQRAAAPRSAPPAAAARSRARRPAALRGQAGRPARGTRSTR